MKVLKSLASWCLRCLLCATTGSSFTVVTPSAAAATPRSSLEAMLETIRKRDVEAEDAVPFLPPLPARPRCRGRPPTPTPRRRSLPPGFKLGNGEEGQLTRQQPSSRAAPPSPRTGRPPTSSTPPSKSPSTIPGRGTLSLRACAPRAAARCPAPSWSLPVAGGGGAFDARPACYALGGGHRACTAHCCTSKQSQLTCTLQ